jgi:pimeloyl-ACP methyl ester carboxylesterase
VLYAHGYVPANQEIALPQDVIGGQSISGTLTGLGYAFATTSYRANGLVAPEATEDLVELEATVRRLYRPDPIRSVLVGFSEGGLVATLGAEQYPELFDGALAGCGPIGDFQAQLNYIGDFRVVPAIVIALGANLDAALELIRITGAPVTGNDLQSVTETSIGILWYDVFGIADARARLGGQPFDNSTRVYTGSVNDAALNAGVQRHSADPAASAALARFQTSGSLTVPLTTLHTTGDEIVPFSQSQLYGDKVSRGGAPALLTQSTIEQHGHCAFQGLEILSAFTALMEKVRARAATPVLALARP